MSIQETFPSPLMRSYNLTHWGSVWKGDKDNQAIGWMGELSGCMYRRKELGIAYARGSWGYTATNKTNGCINEELGRRFIVEVIKDADSEKLQFPDLATASQDDIKSLTRVFDAWLRNAVDGVEVDPVADPRFSDFLIIDEGSLRSLAALPNETPPLGPVTREVRRARIDDYGDAYVWLVDSQAVRRYEGVDNGGNYDGLMRLYSSDITDAWFERAQSHQSEDYIFNRRGYGRRGIILGLGRDLWYAPH